MFTWMWSWQQGASVNASLMTSMKTSTQSSSIAKVQMPVQMFMPIRTRFEFDPFWDKFERESMFRYKFNHTSSRKKAMNFRHISICQLEITFLTLLLTLFRILNLLTCKMNVQGLACGLEREPNALCRRLAGCYRQYHTLHRTHSTL